VKITGLVISLILTGLSFDEDRCEVKGTPKPLDKYYYFDLYADQDVQFSFE